MQSKYCNRIVRLTRVCGCECQGTLSLSRTTAHAGQARRPKSDGCAGCPGADRKLTYWDCHTGEAIRELDVSQTSPILCVAVHPDGNMLASGGDRDVRLWLYNEGTCFATMQQHTGEITRCMFTADGRKLVTADSHGTLCFWDVADAVEHAQGAQSRGLMRNDRLA